MSSCISCGSKDVFIEEDVECQQTESYAVNEPGSPRCTDIIEREDWHIAICRECAETRFEESLRSARLAAFLIGPGLLVLSVLAFLILLPILAQLGSPLVSLSALLACGFVFLAGVIAVPVGFFQAIRASRRLACLKEEADGYQFSDDDRWEAVECEGRRIIDALKRGEKSDLFENVALPKGTPRNAGMGESDLSYVIAKRSSRPHGIQDILEVSYRSSAIGTADTLTLRAPDIPNEILDALRIADVFSLADCYGEPSDSSEASEACLEIVTKAGVKRVERYDWSAMRAREGERRSAYRLMCMLDEYFQCGDRE